MSSTNFEVALAVLERISKLAERGDEEDMEMSPDDVAALKKAGEFLLSFGELLLEVGDEVLGATGEIMSDADIATIREMYDEMDVALYEELENGDDD